MTHSIALPRIRKRQIRPPGLHWWRAVLMVGLGLLSLMLRVFKGDIDLAIGVSVAVQCFVVFVYWPELRHPYTPYRSPLDPLHFVVLVALCASIGTSLLLP